MTIHISVADLMVALAFCGGFLVSALVMRARILKSAAKACKVYYRNQYNEQMAELVARYKQERASFIHRYEGLVAECERELEWLKAGCDPDKTQQLSFSQWDEEEVGEQIG